MQRRMGEICSGNRKTSILTKPGHSGHSAHSGHGDNNNISPFYCDNSNSGSFVLYLEPILNSYYQSYQNIITINTMPPGPLSHMVSKIDMPKLSPYQQSAAYASPFYNGCNCVHALMRYRHCTGSGSGVFKCSDAFMGADDIPAVFSFLMNNGYTIDTSISKMMFQGRVVIGGVSDRRLSGDRKMIAMISYSSCKIK